MSVQGGECGLPEKGVEEGRASLLSAQGDGGRVSLWVAGRSLRGEPGSVPQGEGCSADRGKTA